MVIALDASPWSPSSAPPGEKRNGHQSITTFAARENSGSLGDSDPTRLTATEASHARRASREAERFPTDKIELIGRGRRRRQQI
jgi:hypothetical protein